MNARLSPRLGLLMLLFLAACNVQAQPTLSALDRAATIVALTLPPGTVPTARSTAATPSATAATATATTKPSLFINTADAKCLSGAGSDFKQIASFASGTTVDMIAKDTAHGYWLVKDPASGSSCWVRVQDATPAGSFDLLPEVTAQVSAMKAPEKPAGLTWNFNCDTTGLHSTLGWSAPSGIVNGYHVYRQGVQIADVPAGTTSYADSTSYTFSTPITFAVEAYNDAGPSPQAATTFHCP